MKEISILIDNKKYDKAIDKLNTILKLNSAEPYANYLMGWIYKSYDYQNKSDQRAKQYFHKCIVLDSPIQDAYVQLSYLEKNTKHSIRIINKGLAVYPDGPRLLVRLLELEEYKNKINVFNKIMEKDSENSFAKKIMLNAHLENNEYQLAINIINLLSLDNQLDKLAVKLLNAYCLLKLEQSNEALTIFKELINEDIGHDLNYAPYFGGVLCYLRQNNRAQASDVFAEIPLDCDFEPIFSEYGQMFNYNNFIEYSLNTIITKLRKKQFNAKAHGLRGLYIAHMREYSNVPVANSIQDLELAISSYPNEHILLRKLSDLYYSNGDVMKSYLTDLHLINSLSYSSYEEIIEELSFDFIKELDAKSFENVMNDIGTGEFSKINLPKSKWVNTFFNPVIEKLFSDKKHLQITNIADRFSSYELDNSSCLFEIAYSYKEQNKNSKAKDFYLKYIRKDGKESSAAHNNIGVLFEEEGDFKRAFSLFENALKFAPADKIASRNLKRLQEKIKAANDFKNESLEIRKLLAKLCDHRDFEGIIKFSKNDLSDILNIPSNKADSFIERVISKQYLLERNANTHNKALGYILNPEIERELSEAIESISKLEEVIVICNSLTVDDVHKIGYNKSLVDKLSNVNSIELQIMLKRDLKEASVAVLSGSNKSVLILCGSIVEAILLDKVVNKNIKRYSVANGQMKNINRMDLGDLLYVCYNEKIISESAYHLAHALRGFRNLIHPGVEQRKGAMSVNNDNARLAWDVTKKIIQEL